MRPPPLRFSTGYLVAVTLVLGGCNAIFGIEDGVPDGAGGGGGSSATSTSTSSGTAGTSGGVTWLFAAQTSTVAVLADGSVDLWGDPNAFNLTTNTNVPTPYGGGPGTGTLYEQVVNTDTASYAIAYALTTSGLQLVNYGEDTPDNGLLTSGYADFVDARPCYFFDIGLRKGGSVVLYGRVANSVTATVGEAETVPGITATAVAACVPDHGESPSHACAILGPENTLGPAGSVACWGDNEAGEVGIATSNTPISTPTVVDLNGEEAVSIAAARDFTCAATQPGNVYCWGANDEGQLGSSAPGCQALSPVQVPGIANALGVTAHEDFACAWLRGGTAKCWGDNGSGQLGDGALDSPTEPVAVAGLTDVAMVSAGSEHACALRTNGSVACWGSSEYGQVGTGATGGKAVYTSPQVVLGQ
jgi:Regulator of chromosome condensation (RCC1) repeat